MGAKNGRKKVLGPLPALFVGVGPCAERTLSEFSRLARRLTVPVQGPFGLVLMDSYCEDLFRCDWTWVADFKVPEPTVLRERSEYIGRQEDKLVTALAALLRRLRSIGPVADPAGPGRVRMGCSVLLDLSDPGVVPSAVQIMQSLRKADPALDVTVVGLTDRTAGTDSACDDKWFEVWKQLLSALQGEPFAQRVYLLDGCDADRAWFERPEQLHQLGAEFLLYHELICRDSLRHGERARTTVGESLLNVCGSFGCRTVRADLSLVAERIAERVASEDLAVLYDRPLPEGWAESVDEQVDSLVEKIATVCERAYQAKTVSSNERGQRPTSSFSAGEEIDEAFARSVKHVCSREPLASLGHFFRALGPKLGKLLTCRRLWERARARQSVAEAFHRQNGSTYEPIRTWLSQPDTRWTDRFTPEQKEVSYVAVGQPASRAAYFAGVIFLLMGLFSISAGLWMQEKLFVIGGGLLSTAACVLMTLPIGWVRHTRGRVREGEDVSASTQAVAYRRRASGGTLCVATLMVLAGLAGLTWPLWPEAWTSITTMWALVLAVVVGVGVASIVGCPSLAHPDRASGQEAPGHVSPPAWQCRAVGVACLALAWVIFCLGLRSPVAPGTPAQWIVHLAGLGLMAVGLAWALLPRVGRAYFIDRVAKIPQPVAGGIGRPAVDQDLGDQLTAIAGWIDRLRLEPNPCLGLSQATCLSLDRETLFDFLSPDWEEQLAEAFRLALESRSGKSLIALALQPVLWTECVTKELRNPHVLCPDLTVLFTVQAVKAWLESYTLPELLALIHVDVERFHRLTSRMATPHWPAPRVEPDMNAGVVAVAKPVWDLLNPLAQMPETTPIIPIDWDVRSDAIVVARVAQGLPEGWRGYPGMPGLVPDGVEAQRRGSVEA